MKKIFLAIAVIAVIIIGYLFYVGSKTVDADNMALQLSEVATLYADAMYKTDQMVAVAEESDYESFSVYLDELISEWELIETMSLELEETASVVIEQAESETAFNFVNTAHAYYDKETITKIFDEAPAGQKIRTLAQQLGISARKAYTALKMSQEELKAEAWNTAGDQFETLENGARTVKNASKVGLYVGGAVVTGGATTVLGEAAMVVTGTDLLLEVGEDTSSMFFGYNSDATAVFGGTRTYTKPVATIIGITNLASDKNIVDTTMFILDQTIATEYDNEFLGVKIDAINATIDKFTMDKADADKWFEEQGVSTDPEPEKVLGTITDIADDLLLAIPTVQMQTEEKTEVEEEPISENEEEIVINEPIGIEKPTSTAPSNIAGTSWKYSLEDSGTIFFYTFSEDTVTMSLEGNTEDGVSLAYTYSNGVGQIAALDEYTLPVDFTISGDTMTLSTTYGTHGTLTKISD